MAPTRSPSIWDERTLGPESILLDDRVAVVTGAAHGIGEATAICTGDELLSDSIGADAVAKCRRCTRAGCSSKLTVTS